MKLIVVDFGLIHILWRRFNMGEGQEENAIVTSTGRYVVAWDFGKVKKNKLDSYVIKKWVYRLPYEILLTAFIRYEDDVVQDNFKFGDDNEIVRSFSVARHVLGFLTDYMRFRSWHWQTMFWLSTRSTLRNCLADLLTRL